jgi:hypothetical protein
MTLSPVLRPNATVALNATVTGAANGHTALSDVSNASYISASTGVSTFEIGTFTLPAGAVVKAVASCSMTFKANVGEAATAYLTLADGTLLAGTFGSYDPFVYPAFLTYGLGITYGPLPTTQALIDGLRMSVETVGGAQVSEVSAQIRYVTIPVVAVTAVTPDPYTASNIVPISWVNTLDSDGGAQTRYRVKVFTAAQYGIGGFDPETSPFTYDSGELLGANLSANVGPLATATTYRAYVKVAQTVNGVSHWSDWGLDQFQVSVATSDISTVTAVANNSTASITVTVTRNGASSAWNFVEVQRSVDAGVTWSDVRSATYVDATGNANTFVVTDHETANGQTTLYRARATRIVSSLPITGAWVSSSSVSWTSSSAWLKSPLNPAKNMSVTLETPFAAQERTIRAGEFAVLGRAAPVVISDVVSLPGSVMKVRTDLAADLPKMIALLSDINLLFQQIPESRAGQSQSGAQYVTVRSFTEEQRVGFYTDMRLWTIGYLEVDAPPDPTAGR